MLRWYAGRAMRTDLSKTIAAIESAAYSPAAHKNIARTVVQQLARVETEETLHGKLIAATALAQGATRERQMAVASGATNRSDVRWAIPAIVESWSIGLVGSMRGNISKQAFSKIDDMLWRYLNDVLTPEEIAEAAGLAEPQ